MYSILKKWFALVLILSMVLTLETPLIYSQANDSISFNALSSGSGWHNLVLQNDGTVWAWGDNFKGQLGIGRVENNPIPGQVKDPSDATGYLTNVVAVARNEYSSLALKKDGTLWEWGARAAGNHTDNAYNMYSPSKVKAKEDPSGYLSSITAISESPSHAIALRTDGTVWTWGNGSHGALGYRESTTLEAHIIPNVKNAVAVAAGDGMTAILKKDSSVWFCGDIRTETDFYIAEEDLKPLKDSSAPSGQLLDIEKMFGGRHNMAFIKNDGSVWILNKDSDKDLVCSRVKDLSDKTGYLSGVRSLAFTGVGYCEELVILKNDGNVYTLTGSEDGTFIGTPTKISGADNIVQLAAGSLHIITLKNDGTLLSWGKNNNYQLGNGNSTDSNSPVQVKNLKVGSGAGPVTSGSQASPKSSTGSAKLPAQNEAADRGNTSGNLQNGGYAAKLGDYIYYANPLDGYRLYKIKTDNTSNTKLSNNKAECINVMGKWVYYKNTDNGKLYKVGTDGKNPSMLVNEIVESVTVWKDSIYFIAADKDRNNCIYKTDLNGKGKKLLVNSMGNAYNLLVSNNYLFYRISGYNVSIKGSIVRLYRTGLDGSEQREIGQQVTYMDVAGDWVFTAAINDKTYRMLADESSPLVLDSGNAKHINISGDWIYYANGDDNGTLYRIKTDGSQKTKISGPLPAEVAYINIVGDWIYTNMGKLKINNK